jgi:hypothetical protein
MKVLVLFKMNFSHDRFFYVLTALLIRHILHLQKPGFHEKQVRISTVMKYNRTNAFM